MHRILREVLVGGPGQLIYSILRTTHPIWDPTRAIPINASRCACTPMRSVHGTQSFRVFPCFANYLVRQC